LLLIYIIRFLSGNDIIDNFFQSFFLVKESSSILREVHQINDPYLDVTYIEDVIALFEKILNKFQETDDLSKHFNLSKIQKLQDLVDLIFKQSEIMSCR